jgi:hypothetical protein
MNDKMTDIDFDDFKSRSKIIIKDDRRMGVDRRLFSYDMHFPERRSGKDRRNVKDRRKFQRLKINID